MPSRYARPAKNVSAKRKSAFRRPSLSTATAEGNSRAVSGCCIHLFQLRACRWTGRRRTSDRAESRCSSEGTGAFQHLLFSLSLAGRQRPRRNRRARLSAGSKLSLRTPSSGSVGPFLSSDDERIWSNAELRRRNQCAGQMGHRCVYTCTAIEPECGYVRRSAERASALSPAGVGGARVRLRVSRSLAQSADGSAITTCVRTQIGRGQRAFKCESAELCEFCQGFRGEFDAIVSCRFSRRRRSDLPQELLDVSSADSNRVATAYSVLEGNYFSALRECCPGRACNGQT